MKSLNPEPKPAAGGRQKTGVLLINLGTPAAPTAAAVRPYLRSFLSDRRIVDLPALLWQPLLRGVILPLRAKKSAANYAKVWFKEGSPLEVFTRRQCEGLQSRLPEDVAVAYAMSYSEPSIPSAIEALKAQGVGRLIVLPLYPQYAGSSSAAALDQVHDALKRQRNQMSLRTVSRFYDHPAYIGAQAAQIRNYRAQHGSGGKLLFSFHGIPLRHERNGDPYQSECRHSARLIAAELGLGEQDYEVCFQSRFGPAKWLEPNTQQLIKQLAKKNAGGRIDIACPGFVADCLETMEEIAIMGREQFYAAGGKEYRYIPCLNDSADWIAALAQLSRANLQGWI